MKRLNLIFLFVSLSCSTKKDKALLDKDDIYVQAVELTENGDSYQAIKLLSELIITDSLNGKYYFARAYAYLRLIRTDEALKDYFMSVKLNYRKESSFFNIGRIYEYVDDSSALVFFEKAITLRPNDSLYKKRYLMCIKRLKKDSILSFD